MLHTVMGMNTEVWVWVQKPSANDDVEGEYKNVDEHGEPEHQEFQAGVGRGPEHRVT